MSRGVAAATARAWLGYGAALAGLAVLLGAFATHALKGSLDARALEIFHTATQYQMYHALALVALGLGRGSASSSDLTRGIDFAAKGFLAGTLLFSGSLYALALTDAHWLGAVTPLGGLCFIVSWARLARESLRA